MATMGVIGYGTTLRWNGNLIAELTRIGPVRLTTTKVPATHLTSPHHFTDILPGLIDPGDVEIEGWFRPDDTDGQYALYQAQLARVQGEFLIEFPTTVWNASWGGNAYVIGFGSGDATPDGMIPFTATLAIKGKPVLLVEPSYGLEDLAGVEENGAPDPLVFVPAFDGAPHGAGALYTYTVQVNTLSEWIQLEPDEGLSPTPQIIMATATHPAWSYPHNYPLTDGVLSGPITLGDAGTVTTVHVSAREVGHTPVVYTLYVARANP